MKKYITFIFLLISLNTFGDAKRITRDLRSVFDDFSTLQQALQDDPKALHQFVRSRVSPKLSINNISRALLQDKWDQLTKEQKYLWIDTIDKTITRYTMKVVGDYGLNGVEWDNVKFEASDNGFGKIKLPISTKLPVPMSVELLVRQKQKHWAILDFSALNFSFIKLKSKEYQNFMEDSSFDLLIKTLQSKNDAYFCSFLTCNQ